MNKNFLRDLVKAFRTHRYDVKTDGGIVLRGGQLQPHGVLTNMFVGGPSFAERGEDRISSGNMVVTEGLIYDLVVALANGTKIAAWFLAPYKNNVAPQLTWTAANFITNSGGFTNYTEATRPALIFPAEGSVTTAELVNDGTAITTIDVGTDKTLWGGGVISSSGKAATTGKLFSAVQFGAARSGLQTGDQLAWLYDIVAANPA